jgi:hypothetical protein
MKVVFYGNILSKYNIRAHGKDVLVVIYGREINLFLETSIILLSHFSTKETMMKESKLLG